MSDNMLTIDTESSNAEGYDSMDTTLPNDFTPRIRLPAETSPEILSDVDQLLLNFECCSLDDEAKPRVFIYDFEDITKFSNEQMLKLDEMCPGVTSGLANSLYHSILRSANFNDPYEMKAGDFVNIEDAVNDGTDLMSRISPKYDALRQIYNRYSDALNGSIIEHELIKNSGATTNEQESKLGQIAVTLFTIFGESWAKKCLDLVANKAIESHENYANVVICEEGLVHATSKLLMVGYSSAVSIKNVFSTTNASKTSVLERIQRKFGDRNTLLVVTSNPETMIAAESLQIPVWPAPCDENFKMLHCIQQIVWLK